MFLKADLDKIWEMGIDIHNANCSLKTVMAQLKALTEGQDKLMQSHAALEQERKRALFLLHEDFNERTSRIALLLSRIENRMDNQKQYLCDSFLAVRALLTALDRRLGEKHPYTQQMWNDIQVALNNKFEQLGRTQQVNGKRKRKAA